MEIQSSFNAGVQGFQKATEDARVAAAEIAGQTLPIADQETPVAVPEVNTDITQSIVDLKVAEHQAEVSANVIRTADETLGTLLDVRV